jgi:hypothetical protein
VIQAEPAGPTLAREMDAEQVAGAEARSRAAGGFSNHLPDAPVPVRGELTYRYGPEWLDIAPSRLATRDTYAIGRGSIFT